MCRLPLWHSWKLGQGLSQWINNTSLLGNASWCANLSVYLLHPCCPAAVFLLSLPAPELPLQLQLVDKLFSSLQGLLLGIAVFLHLQLQLLLPPCQHLSMRKKGAGPLSGGIFCIALKVYPNLKSIHLLHEPFSGFPLFLPLRFSFLPHMLSLFSKLDEMQYVVLLGPPCRVRFNWILLFTCVGYQTQPPSPAPTAAALRSHASSRRRQRRPFPCVRFPSSYLPPRPPARLPGSCGLPPGQCRGV